jgi:hypothetical protein
VVYNKIDSKWYARRWSKKEKHLFNNGTYKDEDTAALASDTLARKFIANGEKGHKLNFPENEVEVNPEKRSNYIGVTYEPKTSKWRTRRYSRNEKTVFYNGTYKNEDTAAHASDTLARKLIANDEKGHKLNFPDDDTEVKPETKQE